MPQPFYPWERELLPIVQESGWAPGPVWRVAEDLTSPGFDPRSVQPVGSCYINYAIPPPSCNILEHICVFKLQLMCYLPCIHVYSFNKKPAQCREIVVHSEYVVPPTYFGHTWPRLGRYTKFNVEIHEVFH